MKNLLAAACSPASILVVALLAITFSLRSMAVGATEDSEPIDIGDWTGVFAFHYDYVVAETAGLPRDFEPIEVTLSVPGNWPQGWHDHIRVVRLESDCHGRLVPHRGADGMANVEGIAPGALGILDRDVPWVAGYEAEKGYGMATLRRSQFVGNRLGGPIPHSAPCTYVSNYGWAFTYWSRPMILPLGMKQTAEDQNMVVAAGTIFTTEEGLLVFQPDAALSRVRRDYRRFVEPLKLQYQGTGPW